MRTLSPTEIAQIIFYVFLCLMVALAIIKMCMNWYNSSRTDEENQDYMLDKIIAKSLEKSEREKAEARQRLRLDMATQVAAGVHANPTCNSYTAVQISNYAFEQADSLLNQWERENKPKPKPFVKEDEPR